MAYRRRRYQNTAPRELTAKYAGQCRCGKEIQPGDPIVLHRGAALCVDCGRDVVNGHLAEVSMERYGNDLYFER